MTDYISNINGNSLGGDVFDGLPDYTQEYKVFSDITFTANQYRTYSLASIIPNDGYDYEVLFEATGGTGSTSGNSAGIMLYSGTATSSSHTSNFNSRVARCITRTSSTQRCGGTAILPITSSDKNITVLNIDGSGTSGVFGCYVKGLKRTGTNQRSLNTEYVSRVEIDDNNGSRDIGGNLLGGQWVSSSQDIVTGLSLATNTTKEYDLSSYLPDDDYSYEVMFAVTGRTGTTSGNTMILRVGNTSSSANPVITNQSTRASNYMVNGGNGRTVIGSSRKIYITNTGNATATNINFYARAYRRVGTNSTVNTPNICIKSDTQVPNALIYGNPTISSDVVSNFSSENYLDIPNGKQDNSEYVINFTTGSTTNSTVQDIICAEYFFVLEIDTNSWNVTTYNWQTGTSTTLFTATANTTYWVKIEINGTTKTYSYSTVGDKNYTQVANFSDSLMDITANYPLRLGNHSLIRFLSTRPFLGSIDLSGCYINVNGNRFLDGMDYKKYYPIGGNIADGQWTRNDMAVFDGITLSNGTRTYTVNNFLPEDDTPYEILVCSYGRTGTTSGNSATWWISPTTDVIGIPVMGYINTRTASYMSDAKGAIIVCTQRNGTITFSINITSSATTGNCGLWLTGYRKIGTNQ